MSGWRERFAALEARRSRLTDRALAAVRTVDDRSGGLALRGVANNWSAAAFDGPFFESLPRDRISLGVVFVRSREGNTGSRNPAALGGGAVDEQVIYEGLSRVAADAVVAGAGTLHPDAFFTVWRPEWIELRRALGLPRHPAQVVLSASGSVGPQDSLLFNVPGVPVYVLTTAAGRERLSRAISERPWMHAVVGASLAEQFAILARAGIRRACSIGGRRSATALVDAGLVQDVYLTTTQVSGGEPETPWYVGARMPYLRRVIVKQWQGDHGAVTFEHGVI